MIYAFHPAGFLGRPLSLVPADDGGPLKGNDVIALQTACGLPLEDRDGVFGRTTDAALRALQTRLGVAVDGVSGPGTERAFCLRAIDRHDEGVVKGLPRGIVEGESGYRFGAQSPTYFRDGRLKADVGAVQFATFSGDEPAIRRALNPDEGVSRLCTHLRDKRAQYLNEAFVRNHREPGRIAGWLSCGSWNAPAWTDVWAKHGPDTPFLQVIIRLQNGELGTREQWIRNYVASKISYVDSWQV